jgi:hypothetical protein
MGARQSLPQNQPTQPIKKPEFTTLSKEEAVVALTKANKQDFFIDEVAHDELNRKARANLQYIPVDGPDYLYNGPPLKYDVNLIWMHTTAEGGMHIHVPQILSVCRFIIQVPSLNQLLFTNSFILISVYVHGLGLIGVLRMDGH